MATSEPLVPTGQPYGERAETVAAMRQAGLPLSPPPAGSSGSVQSRRGPSVPPSSPGAPTLGSQLLRDHTPGDFPFLAEPDQAPASSSEPRSLIQSLAAASQSSFGRAVLSRLLQQQQPPGPLRITEDDPRWNAQTMGNRRAGPPPR